MVMRPGLQPNPTGSSVMTTQATAKAFSLVELLVTVSIMAVLIAILLPSLSIARQAARTAVCMSNTHQLGLAASMYTQDSRGWLWRYYQTRPTGRQWWFGFETGGPGSGANRPLELSGGVLWAYLDGMSEHLQCPSFEYGPDYFPKFQRHAASYGFNLHLGPASPALQTCRVTQLKQPARTMLFVDAIHFDFNPGYNEGHYVAFTPGANAPSGYAHFRHRNLAQMVMVDGSLAHQTVSTPTFANVAGGPAANLSLPPGPSVTYGLNR